MELVKFFPFTDWHGPLDYDWLFLSLQWAGVKVGDWHVKAVTKAALSSVPALPGL